MPHENTHEITCPHCDYEFTDSWESGVGGCEQDIECGMCFEIFVVRASVLYSSNKKPDINTEPKEHKGLGHQKYTTGGDSGTFHT